MRLKIEVFGTRDRQLCEAIDTISSELAPLFKDEFGEGTINIIFVNNKYISQLNRQFLRRKGPTDVISFPLNTPIPPKRKKGKWGYLIGEVYVSREEAKVRSRDRRTPLRRELLHLVKHGILHLAGLTHQDMDRWD